MLYGSFCKLLSTECNKVKNECVNNFFTSNADKEIKLILLCGNHDAGMISNAATINEYKRNFGDDYYAYLTGGVMFVVINTSYLYYEKNEMEAKQYLWLKSVLNNESRNDMKHIVIFQHVPWFVREFNEPTSVENINAKYRADYLNLLYKNGVKYIFAGHVHGNFETKFKDMNLITTTSLNCDGYNHPHGFRLVKVYENHISHRFFALNETVEIQF
ncbi:serine/threonine-protein phosphatase CPPED1-like protein [Dinothrombium tinctorium]|uniref:Serine/threonine-protein phosphatase CPPED1-like protein n=1 Tax=Dinothrombium tinctorium TaxID=1965070 RepID=A0A3S3QHN8_9ACAR|nr:serine/threonine-protein phosphatase CPPED1-like protein [Dinothrombium tinctorium]RWS08912.1 serine/threonine-protein phosphatase CPPED1-like protein [Dinothrombium tinctorium]